MLWRLLTGRVTRVTLLTFLIVVALRAVYLINKHDADYLQRTVFSFMGTPEPTLAILDWMVIPAPEVVETMAAPLSAQGYEHAIQPLMAEFSSAVDGVNQTLIAISAAGEMAPSQYNKFTRELADALNQIVSVAMRIRQINPPNQYAAFHQRLLDLLTTYEQVNRALIADYDNPNAVSDTDNEELMRKLNDAVNALDAPAFLTPAAR